MNSLSKPLSKEAKKQVFYTILGLLFLFLLNACGNNKNNASYNLDDRQAPFLITGKINYTESYPVEEEFFGEKSNDQKTEPKIERILRKIVARGDYGQAGTEDKVVELNAEVLVSTGVYTSGNFKGIFDRKRQNAILTDPNIPHAVLVAQCLEDCAKLLVHSYMKEKVRDDGVTEVISTQDEIISPLRLREALGINTNQRNDSNKTENTNADVLVDNEKEHGSEDEESEEQIARIGTYNGPVFTRSEANELMSLMTKTREQYANEKTEKTEDVQTRENRESKPTNNKPAGVNPTEQAQSQSSSPIMPVQNVSAVKDEPFTLLPDPYAIMGSGLIFDSGTDENFPYSLDKLGVQYSGQAEGCYATSTNLDSGCKTQDGKRCSCRNGGKIAFSNLFPEEGVGFTRVSQPIVAYASGVMYRFLEKFSEKYSAAGISDSTVAVNHISFMNGGRVSNGRTLGHRSHENGLDVDIVTPKTSSGAIDYKALWEMLKSMYDMQYEENGVSTPLVTLMFIDNSQIRGLCNKDFVRKDDANYHNIFKYLKHEKGHASHIHVRLKCTAHNKSCRQITFSPVPKVCDLVDTTVI